jgi:hypothetical protein
MNTLTRKYNHPRNGVDALRRVMLPSVNQN